jgi:dihydroorotate dehydrogenase
MIYPVVRGPLFCLSPERAHALTLRALRALGAVAPGVRAPPHGASPPDPAVSAMGLSFANRVGIAAGFDKNGTAVDGLLALGFGHVEVGTVTPKPQAGNPQPRVFRLVAANALINRMGFPNDGAERVVARLKSRTRKGVVGVNIGKNAVTPLERAVDDYVACFRVVASVADYVTVNVSSPNTAGLRTLQQADQLRPLLGAVLDEARTYEVSSGRKVPILLKVSPDLSDEGLKEIGSVALSLPVAGIIATNTTLARDAVQGQPHAQETGGLSGSPLVRRSREAVRLLRSVVGPQFCIVGVGGVSSAEDARLLREAGADLVQVYTALVYRGPGLVRELANAL